MSVHLDLAMSLMTQSSVACQPCWNAPFGHKHRAFYVLLDLQQQNSSLLVVSNQHRLSFAILARRASPKVTCYELELTQALVSASNAYAVQWGDDATISSIFGSSRCNTVRFIAFRWVVSIWISMPLILQGKYRSTVNKILLDGRSSCQVADANGFQGSVRYLGKQLKYGGNLQVLAEKAGEKWPWGLHDHDQMISRARRIYEKWR